jgi:hypothetical protein
MKYVLKEALQYLWVMRGLKRGITVFMGYERSEKRHYSIYGF